MSSEKIENTNVLRDLLRKRILAASQKAEKNENSVFNKGEGRDVIFQLGSMATTEENAFGVKTKETSQLMDAEVRQQDAKTEQIKTQSKSLQADSDLKCQLANRTFRVVEVWIVCVGLFMCIHFLVKNGDAEPNVLLGVIGVTPVILGLAGYILKGLFNSTDVSSK